MALLGRGVEELLISFAACTFILAMTYKGFLQRGWGTGLFSSELIPPNDTYLEWVRFSAGPGHEQRAGGHSEVTGSSARGIM